MRRYTPGKNRKVHRVTVTKNPQKYCLDNGVLYIAMLQVSTVALLDQDGLGEIVDGRHGCQVPLGKMGCNMRPSATGVRFSVRCNLVKPGNRGEAVSQSIFRWVPLNGVVR